MKICMLIVVVLLVPLSRCFASCEPDLAKTIQQKDIDKKGEKNNKKGTKMKVSIGDQVFTATLDDNPTARAFRAMLPLIIDMTELNGNEKYFDLSKSLPANSAIPEGISEGELMLYGSRTLVLFYKTFSTSYSYTKIGRIDNISGLVKALGTRKVLVKFEP